jgi:hypothetical protein
MRLAPNSRLIVVDDGSTSRTMTRLLSEVQNRGIEVWRRGPAQRGDMGGLYDNMQLAYQRLRSDGYRLALFSQDDIQPIREVTASEIAQWRAFFDQRPDTAQIDLRFSHDDFDQDPARLGWEVDQGNRVLFPTTGTRVHFSAVGLFDLERLEALRWTFAESEASNDTRARALGLRRTIAGDPILMHTPWPSVRRSGRIKAAVSILDLIVGSGTHPYRPMSSEEVSFLKTRQPLTIPSGNVWLNTADHRVLRPFHYFGSHVFAVKKLQERGWWRQPEESAPVL